MDIQTTIKYRGFSLPATQWQGGTNYVCSKDVAILIRKIAKDLGIKAGVRKERHGTINITLPKDSSEEQVQLIKKFTRPFVGEFFDGMIDMASSIDYLTDSGEKLLFGSKYIFVKKDWQ